MLSTESDAAEMQSEEEDAPMQQEQEQIQTQLQADPMQQNQIQSQLQAQIPFPARRERRSLTAAMPPQMQPRMQHSFTNPFSSANGQNFKDDDELPLAPTPQAEPDPDTSDSGPLSLSTRVEYKALPKGQSQTIFGLITVQAAELAETRSAQAERRPMDIVCVLDVSGSMGMNNKINDLKEAVRFIIGEALPQDRLSIVTFQSHAERKIRLRRMDREGKDEAMLETMRLSAGGGTSIAAGLDMGLSVLEGRRQRNSVSAILLLTDGQDHSSRHQLHALTQRAGTIGCGLYAFGFGADHDAELLREISEQARTPYSFVENTATVKEAFAGVVGGLSSIVAQKVELSLESKVVLKAVNTPFEVLQDGNKAKVTIPDLFAAERKDILVELSVPTGDGPVELLTASARYLDLRGSRTVLVQIPPVTMSVELVDEPQPEMEPDAEVSDQRERVEVTRVLEQAAQQSDQGHFQEAQELIRQQRSRVTKRSKVSEALDLELQDAEARMNRSSWQLGSAEVKDAFQMHKMQRCTNMTVSASAGVAKKSKAMYMSKTQQTWTERSVAPGRSAGASSGR